MNRALSLPACRLAAALILPTGACLCGQTAPASSASGAAGATVLSPFEVRTDQDVGYTATSSLAGGRLATDLADTPVALSVMTREFLDDIAASTFIEAAEWAPNASSPYTQTGPNAFLDYQVNFRSISGSFQSRNYFIWYINSDSFNTERLDFARGPNSVVFGDAAIGGTANISTKRAFFGSKTELQYRWSSYGGDGRVTLDVNRKLHDKVALRINVLRDHTNGWRDWEYTNREGLFATLTFQPFKRTQIRVESEWGVIDRSLANIPSDAVSNWDGVTVAGAPLTAGNFGGGLSRRTNETPTYMPTAPASGVVDFRNTAFTSGTSRPLYPTRPPGMRATYPLLPAYEWNFAPSNAMNRNPYRDWSVFVNQDVGGRLFLEYAFNFQRAYRHLDRLAASGNAPLQVDVNRVLPDGQPNPFFLQRYTEAASVQQNHRGNVIWDHRVAVAYTFNTRWTDQRVFASIGSRDDTFETYVDLLGRTNHPTERNMFASVNSIRSRLYESQAGQPWSVPPANANGIATAWGRNEWTHSNIRTTYLQVASSGGWLQGRRLKTMVGIRRDDVLKRNQAAVRDGPNNQVTGRTGSLTVLETQPVTSSLGSVYHFRKGMSVFANLGSSFEPQNSAPRIDGTLLDPFENKGLDVGLRVALPGSKLSGSVSYYANRQKNVRIAGVSGDINAIWSDLNRAENQVSAYSDTYAKDGTGIEVDFTANVTRNWRATFNVAFPKTAQLAGFGETRAYYAAHVETWRRGAAAEADPLIRARILQNVSDIELAIGNFAEGRELNGAFDYTANFFTNYSFREGRLKGLSLGGGMNFRGDRLVTNRPNASFDYIYADGYDLLTLTAAYRSKIFGRNASLQLNVSNVLDSDVARYTSYANFLNVDTNRQEFVGRNLNLQDPRKFVLTLTVDL